MDQEKNNQIQKTLVLKSHVTFNYPSIYDYVSATEHDMKLTPFS